MPESEDPGDWVTMNRWEMEWQFTPRIPTLSVFRFPFPFPSSRHDQSMVGPTVPQFFVQTMEPYESWTGSMNTPTGLQRNDQIRGEGSETGGKMPGNTYKLKPNRRQHQMEESDPKVNVDEGRKQRTKYGWKKYAKRRAGEKRGIITGPPEDDFFEWRGEWMEEADKEVSPMGRHDRPEIWRRRPPRVGFFSDDLDMNNVENPRYPDVWDEVSLWRKSPRMTWRSSDTQTLKSTNQAWGIETLLKHSQQNLGGWNTHASIE